MSLISAHGITKTYGTRRVLDGASITLEPGDRLGLIGVNGAGKSTLIRILLGRETPDQGEVQRRRGLSVALVEQTPDLGGGDLTVFDVVKRGLAHNLGVRADLERICAQLESAPNAAALDELTQAQAALQDELERAGGWNIEHQADAAMRALQVPDRERRISTLSEGEARRVALCAGLLARPDVLVLDEPTNHIDVETIEWLEEALVEWTGERSGSAQALAGRSPSGALILVTHDRWFLDRVANRHAELDRGDLRLYEGNYSEYLAQKAERDAVEARQEHKRRRAIESELEWVRRRAPARTTKQRARLERFDELVASRPKVAPGQASFRLPHPPRIGKTILELRGVTKALGGRTLVKDLDLTLERGARLGIIGPNGAGKTTLLRMIKGDLAPDAGEVVRGVNTEIAYADQRRPLDPDNTVLSEVAGDSDVVFVGDEPVPVYGFLDGLLFDGAAQRSKISGLSGGERSRVALAKALRQRANLLILDEPTNDLDLPTLRVLEEALIEYPGCVLVVSHDRYFLERVATGVLVFEGGGRAVRYEGGYDRRRLREAAAAAAPRPEAPKQVQEPERPGPAAKPKKRTYKEERELEGMEPRILEREREVAALEAELSDPERLRALGAEVKVKVAELERAKADLERLFDRWAELSAIGTS